MVSSDGRRSWRCNEENGGDGVIVVEADFRAETEVPRSCDRAQDADRVAQAQTVQSHDL